jgi:CMP-N,N'-diacetyllegionaminic acid synthase
MNILGIIPARGGSKGVLGKNIKLLGEKPLICYTIDATKDSKLLNEVILSSDDDEIMAVANELGLKIPFKRPDNLATDESPTIDTVIHALEYYKSNGITFDAVCLLQVTNPFRTGKFIDEAITKFQNSNTDSLISVLEVPHEYNPHWIFEENTNGNLKISTGEEKIITCRQNLPTSFYRDGSIYIAKVEVIMKQRSLYGKSISYILADKDRHVNIDTMKDWKIAEELVEKLND